MFGFDEKFAKKFIWSKSLNIWTWHAKLINCTTEKKSSLKTLNTKFKNRVHTFQIVLKNFSKKLDATFVRNKSFSTMKRSFLDQNSNVFFATQLSQTTPRSQIAQDVPSLSFCLEHKDRKGEERARVCKRSVEASFHSRIERERIRWRGWCKGCRSLRGIIHAISPQAAQWARHLDNKQRRHNYSIPPLRVVVGVEFRSFAPSLHPPWSSNSSHVPKKCRLCVSTGVRWIFSLHGFPSPIDQTLVWQNFE